MKTKNSTLSQSSEQAFFLLVTDFTWNGPNISISIWAAIQWKLCGQFGWKLLSHWRLCLLCFWNSTVVGRVTFSKCTPNGRSTHVQRLRQRLGHRITVCLSTAVSFPLLSTDPHGNIYSTTTLVHITTVHMWRWFHGLMAFIEQNWQASAILHGTNQWLYCVISKCSTPQPPTHPKQNRNRKKKRKLKKIEKLKKRQKETEPIAACCLAEE